MRKFDYDLIVIGSGAAGSAGALMAAAADLKVAIVEADRWGGSPLNYTDVPRAALFHATHLLQTSIAGSRFGISSKNLHYNYPTINSWKNVAMRRAGANDPKSLQDAGVACYHGRAHFLSPFEISVGQKRLSAKHFLIATGSAMVDTGIKIPANFQYLTPDSIVNMSRPPRTIVIVGAGATGCELAQFFAELGTKVLIADIAGRLLPQEDEEVGQVLDHIFNRIGIKVLTQTRVVALANDNVSKRVVFLRGGEEKSVRVDSVMLCTGSTPATDIGLENAGVKYDHKGIKVQSNLRTSIRHIYAAGDVIGGHSSTEKSLLDAEVALKHIVGHSKDVVNYAGLTRVTHTLPTVASVGATEDDCIRNDRRIKKVLVPLSVAQVSNTQDFRDGFVKIITDHDLHIIGASIIAPQATLMIQELAMAVRFNLTPREILATPHPAGDWGELVRIACQRLIAGR